MAQMSQMDLCISLILSPEKETTTTWNSHSSSSAEIGRCSQGETLASALSGPRYPTRVRRTRLRHFLERQEQDRSHRLTAVQEEAVMCSDSSTREVRTNALSAQLLGCQPALHTCPIPLPRPLQARKQRRSYEQGCDENNAAAFLPSFGCGSTNSSPRGLSAGCVDCGYTSPSVECLRWIQL